MGHDDITSGGSLLIERKDADRTTWQELTQTVESFQDRSAFLSIFPLYISHCVLYNMQQDVFS